MSNGASPRPWKLTHDGEEFTANTVISDAEETEIVFCNNASFPHADTKREANAALIVEAVNFYEEHKLWVEQVIEVDTDTVSVWAYTAQRVAERWKRESARAVEALKTAIEICQTPKTYPYDVEAFLAKTLAELED